MYLYTLVNSINPAFAMGCLFGVTLLICLASLTSAYFASTKIEYFGCVCIFMVALTCLHLVLKLGAYQ